MKVSQTKGLGKDKSYSLFTFQRENFWREEDQQRREELESKTLHTFPKPGREGRTQILRHVYQQNGTNPNTLVQQLMQQIVQHLMQVVQFVQHINQGERGHNFQGICTTQISRKVQH